MEKNVALCEQKDIVLTSFLCQGLTSKKTNTLQIKFKHKIHYDEIFTHIRHRIIKIINLSFLYFFFNSSWKKLAQVKQIEIRKIHGNGIPWRLGAFSITALVYFSLTIFFWNGVFPWHKTYPLPRVKNSFFGIGKKRLNFCLMRVFLYIQMISEEP